MVFRSVPLGRLCSMFNYLIIIGYQSNPFSLLRILLHTRLKGIKFYQKCRMVKPQHSYLTHFVQIHFKLRKLNTQYSQYFNTTHDKIRTAIAYIYERDWLSVLIYKKKKINIIRSLRYILLSSRVQKPLRPSNIFFKKTPLTYSLCRCVLVSYISPRRAITLDVYYHINIQHDYIYTYSRKTHWKSLKPHKQTPFLE